VEEDFEVGQIVNMVWIIVDITLVALKTVLMILVRF